MIITSVSVLSQMNLIHIPNLTSLRSVSSDPCLGLLSCLLPSGFPNQNLVCVTHLAHASYVHHPSSLFRWWGETLFAWKCSHQQARHPSPRVNMAHRWNDTDRWNWRTRRKSCPDAVSCVTYLAWTDLAVKLGHHGTVSVLQLAFETSRNAEY